MQDLHIKEIHAEPQEEENVCEFLQYVEPHTSPLLLDCKIGCFSFHGKATHKEKGVPICMYGYYFMESLFDLPRSFLRHVTWSQMNKIVWELDING
jgi:hypothetical protein